MASTFEAGKKLYRVNKSLPFSIDNCVWLTAEQSAAKRQSTAKLIHEGEELTLREWSNKLGIPLNAIRQRYFRGKNLSMREILYGRQLKHKPKVKCFKECSEKEMKRKAVKMVNQYKCRDKKLGMICDITFNWFIDNIVTKSCIYCGSTDRIGCDRADNSKGHTIDNVQPCCFECNTIRSNFFTVAEMKVLGETIKQIRIQRKL